MEIPRQLRGDIRAHLQQKEVTLLIGPRQAGKTTLLRDLVEELRQEGHRCLFFNLDIDTDAQFFASQQKLVDRVKAECGDERAFVFIDEVQRIEDAGRFLKGLYDRQLPYKWIATGSGSLELKEKIAESLVGRKRNFYLTTASIWEFMAYQTKSQYGERLTQVLATDPTLADQILRDFLRFGGYPRVVTAPTEREKTAVLEEIFQGYIERDIQMLLRLEKSRAFVTLLQLLAHRAGQLLNFNELASLCGLAVPTLKNYLWYAEKTFIVQSVNPFFKNKEKEIIKSPQYYFLDNGLSNFLTGQLNYADTPDWWEGRFQQFVFQIVQEHYRHRPVGIHFWRTQSQAEVDLVLDYGNHVLPIEVKSTAFTGPKITRSLHSFIEQYQPAEAWVVNRRLQETVQIGQTQVRFLPWYALHPNQTI